MSAAEQVLTAPRPFRARVRTLRAPRTLVRSGGAVLGATLIWHASNFAFNSVSARLLGPGGYSELAATVALLYLASPLLVSIQTVSSRTTTALTVAGAGDEIRPTLRRFTARLLALGAGVSLAGAAASGIVARALHLGSGTAVAIVVSGLALSLVTHCQRGVLQGSERFGRYALSTTTEALGKIAGAALILALVDRSVDGAAAAIPLAASLVLVVNALLLRFLPPGRSESTRPLPITSASFMTVATFGLLAVLLSADVLAAKRYLPAGEAGLYAAVSLCGKTTFFATSAVSLFLFPTFSAQQERRQSGRRVLAAAIVLVAGVSGAIAAIYAAAPAVVLDPLFGSRYAAAGPFLGQIAIAFGAYAVIYLASTYLLAKRRRIVVPVLAAVAVGQIAGLLEAHGAVGSIVHVQLVALALGAAIAASVALGSKGRPT
jgi:O-antigen/teichoic acid export membrane protein